MALSRRVLASRLAACSSIIAVKNTTNSTTQRIAVSGQGLNEIGGDRPVTSGDSSQGRRVNQLVTITK
jgi:hypothetical protein